jgi:CDP-diacylglycerol--glycerol-3-phosphate 3-phosphatidyltransferase
VEQRLDGSAGTTRARLRWLPNAITVARLAGLPVLLAVLITADGPTSGAAAAVFAVLAVSDLVDGVLARWLGAESRFGRIADPLADRLLVLVALAGVLLLDRIAAWGPAVLIAREVIVIAGFAALLRRGVEMRVDLAGKVSSTLTMVGAGGAIWLEQAWVDGLFWAAVAVALATLANYSRVAVARLRAVSPVSTRP